MPWKGPTPNILSSFTLLLQQHRTDYQAIYDFLTDEQQVLAALAMVDQGLDRHSFLSFRNAMANREAQENFSPNVVSPHGQLAPDVFLGYLFARRPIDDLAFVGQAHGRSTHRIQWIMLSFWNAAHNIVQTPLATLYSTLGGPSAHSQPAPMWMPHLGPPVPPYLWQVMFDSEEPDEENATRPEYLNGTLIRTRFPGLFMAMR